MDGYQKQKKGSNTHWMFPTHTYTQLCRLAYQLGLQESRGTARLPAALLEVIIRSADYHPDEVLSHRYQGILSR